MENITKEYDRLTKKQKVASSKILSSLDSLISQAERCRAAFTPPATIPMEIEGDSNNDVVMQDAVDPVQKQAERRLVSFNKTILPIPSLSRSNRILLDRDL